MPIVGIQISLSLVFFVAATKKTFDRPRFVGTLRVSGLGSTLAAAVSLIVPVVEAGLAVALVLSRGRILTIVFDASILVLTTFTGWLVSMLLRGINVRCGCFGRRSEPIGWRSVLRNMILVGVAFLGAVLSTPNSQTALGDPSLASIVAMTSVAALVALLVYAHEVVEFLVLTRRRATSQLNEMELTTPGEAS